MVERKLKSDERDEELDSGPTPKRKSGEHEILALYKSTLKETVVFVLYCNQLQANRDTSN